MRNVSFIGHSDAGKTTLVEALAHHFGATTRIGTVAEGNTICDFTESEREKKHSLGASVVHLAEQELNLIDTPGYPDFVADAITSLGAAGCAAITVSARNDGLPFHATRMWEAAGKCGLARAIIVTKCDHENLDTEAIIENLHCWSVLITSEVSFMGYLLIPHLQINLKSQNTLAVQILLKQFHPCLKEILRIRKALSFDYHLIFLLFYFCSCFYFGFCSWLLMEFYLYAYTLNVLHSVKQN